MGKNRKEREREREREREAETEKEKKDQERKEKKKERKEGRKKDENRWVGERWKRMYRGGKERQCKARQGKAKKERKLFCFMLWPDGIT